MALFFFDKLARSRVKTNRKQSVVKAVKANHKQEAYSIL